MNSILSETMDEVTETVVLRALEKLNLRIARAENFKQRMSAAGISGRGGPIYDLDAQERMRLLVVGEEVPEATEVDCQYAAKYLGTVAEEI